MTTVQRLQTPGKHARVALGEPKSRKRRHVQAQKAADLDQLRWREVALPDRFDDAEGFFGLEEVEDVQVIRDPKSGIVQFRTHDESKNSESLGEPESSTKDDGVDTNGAYATSKDEGGDSWDGFSDEETGQPAHTDHQPNADDDATKTETTGASTEKEVISTKAKKNKKQKALKPKKEGLTSKSILEAPKSSNPFALLEDSSGDGVDVSAWSDLNLSVETMNCLAGLGFSKPTPIQMSSIPEIMKGEDVIGKASTGSGKTLAYGIPILEHYLTVSANEASSGKTLETLARRAPVAMILSPTRELAHQLTTHLNAFYEKLAGGSPRIATVTGGLSILKQQRLLATADIIVGTPGRLWETISQGHGLLDCVRKAKFLVLDEADRLLSEGNFKEVGEILDSLDREVDNAGGTQSEDAVDLLHQKLSARQSLIFSATFSRDLQHKLAGRSKGHKADTTISSQESMAYLLKKVKFHCSQPPKFIDVNASSQMASNLQEAILECGALEKDLFAYTLLLMSQQSQGLPKQQAQNRILVFTNSISAVRRLTSLLQTLELPALALHSQMAQKARLRSIERFSSPSHPTSILIATDVAARGLDIPSVQLVVHYHVPRAADTYVHRSGRTARAGEKGKSVLICAPDEVVGVRRLVAKVHVGSSKISEKMEKRHGKQRSDFTMHAIDLDRTLVARLKERVVLAKMIADVGLAKEKTSHEDSWLRSAADDLGVDYDSEEFGKNSGGGKGRGGGREKKERKASAVGKDEIRAIRGELRSLLSKKVNVGVSERYLTAGGMNVEQLLNGGGEFLGSMPTIDWE
ncbi:ATP-dependent RNA helicase [Agyrium rufum]|nr:ATP-dependent RNA helicase [Agyrium rufum]